MSLDIEQVTIESDGLNLSGMVYKPAESNGNAIVLCHGYGKVKDDYAYDNLADKLQSEGYLVLSYDMRAHGDTGGNLNFDDLVKDVYAATDFLESNYKFEKLGLFGHSLGAYSAAQAASKDDSRYDALVTLGAPTSVRETLKEFYGPFFPFQDLNAKVGSKVLNFPFSFGNMHVDNLGETIRYLYDENQTKLTDVVDNLETTTYVVMQGDKDLIVKPRNAKDIYEATAGDKELVIMENTGHLALRNIYEITQFWTLQALGLEHLFPFDEGHFNAIEKVNNKIVEKFVEHLPGKEK